MIRLSCAWICAALIAFAQQPASKILFEAASVKRSMPTSNWIRAFKKDSPGRIAYENFFLKDLVQEAYGLKDYQVKGPSWLKSERYDIIATKPRGATADQTRLMMQSLLADRFHLATHTEMREMKAYALLPGKNTAKLRPTKDVAETPGCLSFGTLSVFADILARQLDLPVVDQTGIPGTFYFILVWSPTLAAQTQNGPGVPPPPAPPAPPPPCPGWSAATMPPVAPTIFDAVKDQMGLKLELRGSTQVSVLVVDHAEKLPEPN
jgi:uncharacterized protein (TIGR03435 family)